jgi:hypothetical protein
LTMGCSISGNAASRSRSRLVRNAARPAGGHPPEGLNSAASHGPSSVPALLANGRQVGQPVRLLRVAPPRPERALEDSERAGKPVRCTKQSRWKENQLHLHQGLGIRMA